MGDAEKLRPNYLLQRSIGRDGIEILYSYDVQDEVSPDILQTIGDIKNASVILVTDDSGNLPHRIERDGISGYWSEKDMHQLLRVYLKHMRGTSLMRPTAAMWHIIKKEFDVRKRFSLYQIKSKINRIRLYARTLLTTGRLDDASLPNLSSLTELLRLEKAARSKQPVDEKFIARGTMTWSEDETFSLLNIYRKHLPRMLSATSPQSKRAVWNSIASELGRPRFHVQMKFQSLLYTWRRYEGSDPETSLWAFHAKMSDIKDTERAIKSEISERGALREQKNEDDTGVERNKWSCEETAEILRLYKNYLTKLNMTGIVKTKRSVYVDLAKEMGLTATCVQIKIVSLRAHWQKLKENPWRKSNWIHMEPVSEIMRLETLVWGGFDETDRTDRLESNGKPTKVCQRQAILEWAEQFQLEERKRHEERIAMKNRIHELLIRCLELRQK